MKNTVLNIRVDESVKEQLEILCYTQEKNLSSLVREVIKNYFDNSDKDTNNDYDLLQSLGFTEFIFWLYDKKRNPAFDEIESLYIQFVELISSMEQNELFEEYIMIEFRKVRLELEKYLYSTEEMDNFNFSSGTTNAFNYDKLSYFMHGLRYDKDNKKVIHVN